MRIAFSILPPPYCDAESLGLSIFWANTDCKHKGKCCWWLHLHSQRVNIRSCMVFVHPCACSVSLEMHVCREVATWFHLNPSSAQKWLICPIYYRLFHSIVRGPRIHTPLDWNHCHRENLANTLRGAAILKVSESLIFSRKSSRRIYGKWESGDGKWSSSAGYSVITVFFYRQATVSSYVQACG